MLIAEDLLLLVLDDDKGTLQTVYARPALGGAVLVELALTGAVEVEEKTSAWKSAKVRVTGREPDDEVLRDAYALVAQKERSAQDLVQRLGRKLQDRLAERLAAKGVLERRRDRMLGLIPVTRWPTADATRERQVRDQLTAALVQGVEPDERTGSLVALLHAIGRAHKVVDRGGLSAGQVRKRAKQIGEGDWAAKAVRDAITASTAAIAAASTAATTAAVSG